MSRTMKAVVQREYGGPETLTLSDARPVPIPGAGEVRVRVHAASVAAGDVHMMTGRPYMMRLFGFGLMRPKHGQPGLDVAGVVDAVGDGVSRLKVGDEVYGELQRGSFAEFAVGPEALLARMPAGLSFNEAAAMPTSGIVVDPLNPRPSAELHRGRETGLGDLHRRSMAVAGDLHRR